jgi:hypothetical protein
LKRAHSAVEASDVLTKVPQVTLTFWIIKIAATTLGETGGDSVTMTLNWGYLTGTAIFLVALVVLVAAQIVAKKFHPFLYWATIVASTTFGTTMADFAKASTFGVFTVSTEMEPCDQRLRRRPRGSGCGLFLDQCLARNAVLGGVYSHPTAWRDRWRSTRQARQ